ELKKILANNHLIINNANLSPKRLTDFSFDIIQGKIVPFLSPIDTVFFAFSNKFFYHSLKSQLNFSVFPLTRLIQFLFLFVDGVENEPSIMDTINRFKNIPVEDTIFSLQCYHFYSHSEIVTQLSKKTIRYGNESMIYCNNCTQSTFLTDLSPSPYLRAINSLVNILVQPAKNSSRHVKELSKSSYHFNYLGADQVKYNYGYADYLQRQELKFKFSLSIQLRLKLKGIEWKQKEFVLIYNKINRLFNLITKNATVKRVPYHSVNSKSFYLQQLRPYFIEPKKLAQNSFINHKIRTIYKKTYEAIHKTEVCKVKDEMNIARLYLITGLIKSYVEHDQTMINHINNLRSQ
ncbi:hypothetical protein DID75_05570, partial [Candidatus Marinamargulisbacteria bacterium SCGC AG-410-N11]